MNTRFTAAALSLLACLAGSLSSRAGTPAGEKPWPLRSGVPELFVDDTLIAEQKGLRRTLHRPRKDGGGSTPLIALADEFGGQPATLEANGSIVWDPRLKQWVMFALAFCATYTGPSADKTRLYRYTSKDGLNWTKGDDGSPQRIAVDLLDKASGQSATNVDLFSCCYNAKDREYPYQGWLWFANWGPEREGAYFMRSRDGKTWERGGMVVGTRAHEVRQDDRVLSGAGDVTLLAPDPEQNRFLALVKFNALAAVDPGNLLRARAYAFTDRLDAPLDLRRIQRVDLVPPAAESGGDQPHDEYYASTAWRQGSQWLGGLKIWHGGGDYPYSAAGCAFLKLASSRDGLHWKKVPYPNEAGVPEVWLPNGLEGGSQGRNDGGYMTEFSQGPLRLGDELVFYYGASSWGKNHARGKRVTGGGLFRARLRPEGFVSVDAGTLTTRPLAFPGRDLEVNAVGPVTVEVLDAGGRSLGTARLQGDSLRHPVRFAGKSLRDAAGGTGRLRFTVADGGKLYAFRAK
jgi:hypothetical protein